jgi:hypothetical protein
MLLVSVAIHLVVAGILFGGVHWLHAAPMEQPAKAETESLVLLRSDETPILPLTTPPRPAASSILYKPHALPIVNKAAVTKHTSSSAPDALALEANPNAHLRAPGPDAVLNPPSAPHLNRANGIVFLLDISGSMYESYADTTRLTIARGLLSQRILALKDGTPFSITVYGQTACTSGPLVAANPATREAAVQYIAQDYDCGGGTNLPEGLRRAAGLQPGTILLVTDGDLNISPIDLLLSAHRLLGSPGHGPALSIIGIGLRPKTKAHELLQGLADQQNGTYLVEEADASTELMTSSKNVGATP